MNGLGDQLLAGAGLAAYQYGGMPLGDLANLVEHALHLRGVADDVGKTELAAHRAAQGIALLRQVAPFAFDLPGQAHALADEVGDHLQQARPVVEQIVIGQPRLCGQHADQIAADAHRYGDEGQRRVVQLEPVEEALLVGNALQHDGAAALHDHADDALAALVAHRVRAAAVDTVGGSHDHLAARRIGQTHHAAGKSHAFVQHAQHFVQGFAQIKRARQDLADAEKRLQRRFQKHHAFFAPVFHCRRHVHGVSWAAWPPRPPAVERKRGSPR